MNVSREEKKIEALGRMMSMGIIPDAVKQFDEDDIVMVSENPLGMLYWLNDEQKKLVADFEAEYNALVYLCNTCVTEFGRLFAMLYVSDHKDEWSMDREDIKDGYAIANVVNLDWPEGSDMGSIAFRSVNGGIKRIG